MDELMGKTVIGAQAQVIGEVCDIEFDEKTLKLTGICVKLAESILEPMGIKKPRLGRVRVDIPIETIEVIGDVVTLDKNAQELRAIARRR